MTLTTLLVLYTLFNQVSAALPDTAYIKMVDMWFFFCISVIFSIIVVHLLTECLPQDSTPRQPQPTPKQRRSPLSAQPIKGFQYPMTGEVKVRPVGSAFSAQVKDEKEEEQSVFDR